MAAENRQLSGIAARDNFAPGVETPTRGEGDEIMGAISKVKDFWALFVRRWRNAFPTILFYIVQFLLVTELFGTTYAMVVSCSTTLFQVRRREPNGPGDYLRMCLMSLLLCLLAFAAGRSVWLCILLNFTVPFCLVLWRSSQFTPKGHIGYAMTFVFLELRPPTLEQLPTQLAAVVFCCVLLVIALVLYGRLSHTAVDPAGQISRSLTRLAQLLDDLAGGGDSKTAGKELYELARSFHRMGYDRRHLLQLPDQQKRFYHLFALLFQRASYLVTDEEAWRRARETPGFSRIMHTLADLVRQLQAARENQEFQQLSAQLQSLLQHTDLPQGRLRIFSRSVLHTLLLLCREPLPGHHSVRLYHVPWSSVWQNLRQRLSPGCFEFRFALRLSVVMTISCTVSYLWEFEHTYWFPLHAYLLLQPSYEESAHRMVTRPVGTAIGCLLVHLVYPYLPGLPGVFLFSLVMISLMYCCTPGTWVQPIFSTAFALTMATLTVKETEAIWLRLFYLAMAVALVLVVNRFLLPNRREPQFRRNLQELYRLQANYWAVIRRSLRRPVDPAVFSELLSRFHMVYHEAAQYTGQLPPEQAAYHQARLVVMWNMFAELEQAEGMIQNGAVCPEEIPAMEALARELETHVDPLRGLEEIHPEVLPRDELYYVISRYLDNARTLHSGDATRVEISVEE